jgi:hypothetical protein
MRCFDLEKVFDFRGLHISHIFKLCFLKDVIQIPF